MSHHFDTKKAKENPSFNVCDMYLFRGSPTTTVMAMTVNADSGISGLDTLHPEGLYVIRFDLNGDAREELVFKFRFGNAEHVDGDEHRHVQSFRVIRAVGAQIAGDAGEVLLEGQTGTTAEKGGVKAFVGMAPELWAANAIGFFDFLGALYGQGRFDIDVFQNPKNFFVRRNVTALVLEVPNALIGAGKVSAWATLSLYGHAPEVQIYRWGLPLFTHLFLSNPERPDLPEKFHDSSPAQDVELFGEAVRGFVQNLAGVAKSTDQPEAYGKLVASRLCPVMLPYEIGTPAVFSLSGFNGRPLGVDAFDVMLTLGANVPVMDGVHPDRSRIQEGFPYYGAPYSKAEQEGLAPISTGFY
jgi:hypothetical protein